MTEETLRSYIPIKKERDRLAAKLRELNGDLYGRIRTANLDGMPRSQPAEGSNPADGKIDRKSEIIALYEAKKQELDDTLLLIERAIEILTPIERSVIRLHYIDGLTWEKVGEALNYSDRHCYNIRDRAVEKLEEVAE